jgi:protein-S-isoprenylcysteine O-methyltransferase Ste14
MLASAAGVTGQPRAAADPDREAGGTMIFLTIAVVLWCALHSALIWPSVVRWFEARLGSGFRYYRVGFNAVSLLTLIPILVFGRQLSASSEPVLRWDGPLIVVRIALLVTALALFLAGGRRYDTRAFLGLRQLQPGRAPRHIRFSTGGVLEITRHPWYLGVLALIWARTLDPPVLVTNAVLTAYLIVGTLLEEHKLVAEFGDEYRAYQQRVSMLFPFKWLVSRATALAGRAPQ